MEWAISFRHDTCLEVDPTFVPTSSGSFQQIIAFAVREVVQTSSAIGVEHAEQAVGIFAGDPGMLLQFLDRLRCSINGSESFGLQAQTAKSRTVLSCSSPLRILRGRGCGTAWKFRC